ncbi:MAG: hypothetical protein IJU98_08645 [Synergistaceae bacterium]|nr:hypothetical protein [Synergistaceae bacterium]
MHKQNEELIWAKVWDDTRKGIKWAESLPGISPGRWAVGYNYLYVMTRILNEKEPRSVLDLGLGISSTLISCYFSSKNYNNGIHTIVEQDAEWVKFYTVKNRISTVSNIYVSKCIAKEFNGYKYNAYEDIGKIIRGKKYSVISIDGPIGSVKYSRRDILEFLPEILEDSWIIVMDDVEREGEKETIAEIRSILIQNGIKFHEGVYPGRTFCCVITSMDNKFFCSM